MYCMCSHTHVVPLDLVSYLCRALSLVSVTKPVYQFDAKCAPTANLSMCDYQSRRNASIPSTMSVPDNKPEGASSPSLIKRKRDDSPESHREDQKPDAKVPKCASAIVRGTGATYVPSCCCFFLTVDGQSSRSSRSEEKATCRRMRRRFSGSSPRLVQRAAVSTAYILRRARLHASQRSISTARSLSSCAGDRRATKNARRRRRRTVSSGNGGRPSCRRS